MPIISDLLLDFSNELAQILPLHVLAFAMEIEPSILDAGVLQRLDHLRKLLANPILGPLLVYQIDEVLSLVFLCCRGHMLLSCLVRFIEVGVHYHGGCPLDVGLHFPQQRNGPSDLEM